MTEGLHALGQRLRRDAFDGLLRCGINIQQMHRIGLMKCAREIVHQRLRAGVAMGLEQHVDAAIAAGARGGQSRANLGGMMTVIVDDGDAAAPRRAPESAGRRR